MFPFPIAKPQKCDIQTFVGAGPNATNNQYSWTKPVGVSHVYMLLIGSGRAGDGSITGGGSGAVTVFYCAAQHIPNTLYVWVGPAPTTSYITIDPKGLVSYLTAQSGSSPPTGGAATAAPALAACGFYKSTAGQNGSTADISPSTTTFLSGGADSSAATVTANYGYGNTAAAAAGYFQLQPIIVGVGGAATGNAGIGCGGGRNSLGGPGMVLIASW
jgi:hypothetical protein